MLLGTPRHRLRRERTSCACDVGDLHYSAQLELIGAEVSKTPARMRAGVFCCILLYTQMSHTPHTKKILLSGVKPTGRPHIGNYFGAMKQFVGMGMNDSFSSYIMIADYHALNFIQNKEEMENLVYNLVLDYLALGLDPEKVTIFRQSQIPAHTELAWILSTLTTMPYLMRAHAFKDAEAKNKDINVGTFTYPVLMASDILLYDADVVPVGADQKQHIEITRDLAQKFNSQFGETFKLPEAYIQKEVATVPGTDGRKMSKSYKNTIPLFGNPQEIERAVMSIITDSSGDIPKNVYALHELFKNKDELQVLYAEHKGKYKDLKQALLRDILELTEPLRKRRSEYEQDKEKVLAILTKGEARALEKADSKIRDIRTKIGVNFGLQ